MVIIRSNLSLGKEIGFNNFLFARILMIVELLIKKMKVLSILEIGSRWGSEI